MTDRPGAYSGGRRQTLSGRQDALTGPTPPPPPADTGKGYERAYPPGVNAATAGFLEGLIIEQNVAQEQRLMLRIETSKKAEESAALTHANRLTGKQKSRGDFWRGVTIFVTVTGTLIGTIMGTAFGVYRNYQAEAASEATKATVDIVAPSVAPAVAPLTTRIEASEHRIDAVDERLGRLEIGVTRVLELLEPATQVNVPQGRKRPR